MEFGWNVLGLRYIIGLVEPENTASIHVLEKVGMIMEGTFPYDSRSVLRFGLRV
jgi:RimJ/RimL family protein N-acetyltransferase